MWVCWITMNVNRCGVFIVNELIKSGDICVYVCMGEGLSIKMAEIYKKNRAWLFAVIKEQMPEVVSHLCDEGILLPSDREEVTKISEQTKRLLDVVQKKIISSLAPFDYTIGFARALEKAGVSSSPLADFVKELEDRQETVVSRKSSLPDSMCSNVASDGNKEAQSSGSR